MTPPSPPRPQARPLTRTAHGRIWADDYAWLRAENWREVLRDPAALAPDIRAVLEAENAYADAILAPTLDLQREMAAEMRARLQEDDSTPPAPDGPWNYYSRFRIGGQHRLHCRTPREGGPETVLLDGDARAGGKGFFKLGRVRHSPDHARLAWSEDDKGSELHVIHVRDLEAGRDLHERIENTTGEIVWTRDSAGLLYVLQDENHRPWRVMWRRLGAPASEDVVIFEENDPSWFLGLAGTRLGRRAFLDIHGHDSNETWVVDLEAPQQAPRCLAPRRAGFRYHPMDHGEVFFIRANSDGMDDYQILVAPAEAPEEANWRPFVPGRTGRLIEGAEVFARHLVMVTRGDDGPQILVRDLGSGETHAIAFDAEAYALRLDTVYEFASPVLRFAWSSPARSEETYDYDMATRERRLVKKQMEPPGFRAEDYVVRRLFARAPDGEDVPVSLLHRRDTPIDGTAPLLIYGYGAYGYPIDEGFSTNRLSLVDRGFVFALAHVRGGTDRGWRWYESGKLRHKPNTFADFIAATQHLIALGYSHPRRAIAHGGSAGGMLMGAIANRAPELYAGVIADVPFVDVINTMMDETLPLTPPEWLEWGDPIRDAEAFATMLSYSPCDNVAAQRYPAILALAGLTDPRVTYWEPAKWVARLRATMTGGGPVLLRTSMDAGHAGAPGRFDRLEEVARSYAFAVGVARGEIGGG